MRHTKCDLSHNRAVLDFDAMLKTAHLAVGSCMDRIAEHRGKVCDAVVAAEVSIPTGVSSIYSHADYLLQEAQHLAVASEVLATLIGAHDRSEIVILRGLHNSEEGSDSDGDPSQDR